MRCVSNACHRLKNPPPTTTKKTKTNLQKKRLIHSFKKNEWTEKLSNTKTPDKSEKTVKVDDDGVISMVKKTPSQHQQQEVFKYEPLKDS